ncbi:MAG TPA: hypothetical protein VLT86_05130 [Vicinamibacterales bacterium]|nr:hypothetical protein [Vicinamibacterales bacterium]
MVQQLIVGVVALLAAVVLVRKIVVSLRPKPGPPACDACALAQPDEPPPAPTSR